MTLIRSSGKGEYRLSARLQSDLSRKFIIAGVIPTEETVIFAGLIARPHSAVSILHAFNTLPGLSIGSPIPMKTT